VGVGSDACPQVRLSVLLVVSVQGQVKPVSRVLGIAEVEASFHVHLRLVHTLSPNVTDHAGGPTDPTIIPDAMAASRASVRWLSSSVAAQRPPLGVREVP
jgi:hypothetical protein